MKTPVRVLLLGAKGRMGREIAAAAPSNAVWWYTVNGYDGNVENLHGNLVAIDLNRGEIAWKVPFGDAPAIRALPALKGVALPDRLGAVGPPGAIVTKSGLIFVGGNDMALSAFDARDGRELWRHVLPRQATATPMTYLDANGRQVVVIATGRGEDTALVAFALQP